MSGLRVAAVVLAAVFSTFRAPAGAGSLGGANWPNVPRHSIDPQIAAGPQHVMLAQYDRVYYYDKAGNSITHVGNDPGKPLLVTDLESLFDPIRTEVNGSLYLPDGTACNLDHQTKEAYEVTTGGTTRTVLNYCLTRFGYDARVLYDEWRQRFVVVAVAFNPVAKCKYNDEANYRARRTKILVAYSASADPTDGKPWRLKWFDAVPGEGCPNEECRQAWKWRPGSAADYPIVAIAKDHLLVSIKNQVHEKLPACPDNSEYEDDFDDLQATVHVWNTRALASGDFDEATCKGICSWVYWKGNLAHADGTPVVGSVTAGQGHGDPYLGDGWFAQHDGADTLHLWHFSLAGTSTTPKAHPRTVKLPAFDDADAGDNSYGGPGHAPLQINGTTSLIQKGSHLYFADVGGMRHGGAVDAAIRVVVLKGNASGSSFSWGRNAIFHGKDVGYGSPALEVNGKGDMAMVFRKVGRAAEGGLGARYLVWPAGSTQKPDGASLARDEADLPCSASPCARAGDHDTAGISLAPGGRFYVMQPYIKADRTWGYAVNYVVP